MNMRSLREKLNIPILKMIMYSSLGVERKLVHEIVSNNFNGKDFFLEICKDLHC